MTLCSPVCSSKHGVLLKCLNRSSSFLAKRLPLTQPTVWNTHTHTHTTVLLLFWNLFGTNRVSRYQKGKTRQVKTNLGLLEQEIVSGSGICWAICKVRTSSQTTTPTSHHSVSMVSNQWRKQFLLQQQKFNKYTTVKNCFSKNKTIKKTSTNDKGKTLLASHTLGLFSEQTSPARDASVSGLNVYSARTADSTAATSSRQTSTHTPVDL